MYKTKKGSTKGFTLLEILLVVGAITILAGIAVVALNPAKQLGSVDNATRHAHVNSIVTAVYQYIIDGYQMPSSIRTESKEICQTGIKDDNCVDLSVLTDDANYLVEMHVDPDNESDVGTGYFIHVAANRRITVTAPNAVNDEVISVTR